MTNAEKTMLAELLNKYNTERQAANPQNEIAALRQEIQQLKQQMQQPQQQQNHTQQPQGNDVDAMVRMMMQSLQAQNAQSMAQTQQPQTIDQIVAEIINPPLPEYGQEVNGAQFGGVANNGSKRA